MYNSKLFKLLKTFDTTSTPLGATSGRRSEWKQFRSYLCSEVNEDSEVVLVYDYISKYRKDLSHKKLKLEYAKDVLFRNKTTKNYLNLMSRLHGYVLDYFAIQQFRNDEVEMKLRAMISLNQRRLYQPAVDKYSELIAYIENAPIDILSNFQKLRASHYFNYDINPIQVKERPKYLQQLLSYWLHTKENLEAHYYSDIVHLKSTRGVSLEYTRDASFNSDITIQEKDLFTRISMLVTELIEDGNEPTFQILIGILQDPGIVLSHDVINTIILICIQYKQRQIQHGNESLPELLELYLLGLRTGGLLQHGHLTSTRYTTMIHVACLIGEKELPKKLLSEWEHCIEKQVREPVIHYCNAMIYFYEGNYNQSIHILSSNTYQKGWNNNAARVLLLMNYFMAYKESDPDFVLSQIVNLRSYFRRVGGSSAVYIQGAENFIDLIAKMVKSDSDIELQGEMENTAPLIRRSWLRKYFNEQAPIKR